MRLVMSARSRLRPRTPKGCASLRFMVPSSMPAMVCSVTTMRLRNSKRVRLLMAPSTLRVHSPMNSLSSSQASVGRIWRSVRAFSRAACRLEQMEPGVGLVGNEKGDDVAFFAARGASTILAVELGAAARDVDQRQPARRDAAGQVQQQVGVHVDDARGVL